MDVIGKYFPELTNTQRKQFSQLDGLYQEWNARINVISRKDQNRLYLHHVLHSLSIAKVVSFRSGSRVLDVGTGGGFPGIPLAILFPEAQFVLVDSIGKKVKVVREIADATGLKNVNPQHSRAEEVQGKFDFIVSRAVTRMPVFIPWVQSKIGKLSRHEIPNGILALKGGDLADELDIPYSCSIFRISDFFDEPFFETKKIVHVRLG